MTKKLNKIREKIITAIDNRKLKFILGEKEFLFRKGFYLLAKHYYLPIRDNDDLGFQIDSKLVGIDMNENASFELMGSALSKYKKEFNLFAVDGSGDPAGYYLLNGNYMAIDGNVYYSLIRSLKPKKIIEIGSGDSTLLAAAAVDANLRENGKGSELICVEPFPGEKLRLLERDYLSLVEEKVQAIGLDEFLSLDANDILFIDSTHVLKSGGDVWWEYCEILPRLRCGVYVHIHDISLPKPYPKDYFDRDLFWNEQYLLQAFLEHNSKFEIVWAGNYLMEKYPEKMKGFFSPEYDVMRGKYPDSEPSSLWMRVK